MRWSSEHPELYNLFAFAATEERFAPALRKGQEVAVSDVVIAVAASGTTPFTLACLREARQRGRNHHRVAHHDIARGMAGLVLAPGHRHHARGGDEATEHTGRQRRQGRTAERVADQRLQHLPVVMITSRMASETVSSSNIPRRP